MILHKSMPCRQQDTGSVIATAKAEVSFFNLNTCFSFTAQYSAKPPSTVNFSHHTKNLLRILIFKAANKIDLLEDEETDEKLKKLEEAVKASDLQFFKISAPINRGVLNLMEAAAALLAKTESEKPCEEKEIFDFDREEQDPNYRTVYAGKENDYFVLEGKQLLKIFRSTNFEDIGSLRYLYKYIEKSGAIEELKKKGLKEGDTIKIEDFEFEYMDEF